MTVTAIDPGITGAIAWIKNNKLNVVKMPNTLDEIFDLFGRIKADDDEHLVIMEKVHLRPSDMLDGRVYRMQKLLTNATEIKAMLKMQKMPFIEVDPRTWQGYLNVPKVKDYAERKRVLQRLAQKNVLTQRITIQKADAVLLAIFGIRKQKYDPQWLQEKLNA